MGWGEELGVGLGFWLRLGIGAGGGDQGHQRDGAAGAHPVEEGVEEGVKEGVELTLRHALVHALVHAHSMPPSMPSFPPAATPTAHRPLPTAPPQVRAQLKTMDHANKTFAAKHVGSSESRIRSNM